MNDFFGKGFEQFKEFFAELESGKRMGVITLAIAILVSFVFLVIWASQTQHQVLFSELNKEDASTIARLLEESNIEYLFSDSGKTISVPEDQVNIWRLELAKRGMTLTGTVGYEVFDQQSFGTTSFVQRINKQRALEGELTKTIKYISGVKRARIHLSIPEQSPFVSERKLPAASVVLELDDGVVLRGDEVRGIAHLVAASVEGMRTSDVIIIDSRGRKLSENINDPLTQETSHKMALEQKMSRDYEKKVESILAKVVGSGKVMAKVSLTLDYTKNEEVETSYDSENAVVLSEVVNSQKLKGSRPSPQGLPGARSNVPGEQAIPGVPETKNDVDKSLVTRNFNIPSKTKTSSTPAAKIKNISVAVMLDGKQVKILDEGGVPVFDKDGNLKREYQAWSEEELKSFQEIVSSAIGISLSRGDQIVIRNMQFMQEDLSESEAMLARIENRKLIRNIVKYLAIGLLLTMFFLIVVRPFIQWITENTVESIEDFLPQTIEEIEKLQTNQKLPGLEESLPVIEEKLNPEKVEGNMLKEKIVSLVETNPVKAAQVIQGIMHTIPDEEQAAA